MSQSLIKRSDKGQPLSASDHDSNLRWLDGPNTVQALLADESSYAPGDIIVTREGFRYRVAASDATDHHLTTAGGVKLYVLPTDDGVINFRAFAPAADGVTDDYAKLVQATALANTLDSMP